MKPWMIVKGRLRLPLGWALELVRYYPKTPA